MATIKTAPGDMLAALYQDHHRWLVAWLRRRTGCQARADDLAQDTFLRLLLAKVDLQSLLEPRAYLTVTARRLILEDARRQRIEQAYLETWEAVNGAGAVYPSAESIVQAVEQLTTFVSLLEGLAEKPRQAFIMSRMHGQPHAEIAAQLGVSVSMVKQYIAKVMVHCHALL